MTDRKSKSTFAPAPRERADDLLNIRGVTVFPLAIEEVVRDMDALGDDFAVILTNETGLDELTVQVETHGTPTTHERQIVEDELGRRLRAMIEVRPHIAVVPPGTIPRPEFKTSRVHDQQQTQPLGSRCGEATDGRRATVTDYANWFVVPLKEV